MPTFMIFHQGKLVEKWIGANIDILKHKCLEYSK